MERWPSENKLFVARTIEGEPLFDELEDLKTLDEMLRGYIPGYVACIPYGSLMKGMALPESRDAQSKQPVSDLDIMVLVDVEKFEKAPRTLPHTSYDLENQVYQVISYLSGERKRSKKLINLGLVGGVVNVSDEFIHGSSIQGNYITPLATLFGIGTNKHIEEYRNKWVEQIKGLPSLKRQKIIQNIEDFWTEKDVVKGKEKFTIRTSHYLGWSQERIEAFLENRKVLWRKRIEKFFEE